MQASRASSRAIRQLAASKQTRSLHMTGPAKTSPLLTSERPASNLPPDLAGLRAECHKRKLPVSGTKAELVDRLSTHEAANSRAFSTAALDSKRPTRNPATTGSSVRNLNTNLGDSFYVNLQNLHDYDPDAKVAPIRVPILPHSLPTTTSPIVVEAEPAVMRAEIYTVAGNSTHIHAPSAMADVSDNGAIDFQGLAAKVANKLTKPVEETVGMTRQLWNGLVDDVLGPKGTGPSRA